MTEEIVVRQDQGIVKAERMALVGQAANGYAAQSAFLEYRSRLSHNTRRRIDADLALFSAFLGNAGVHAGDLANDPEAWSGVSWGLVEAFIKWQLQQGYAIGSVNIHLSTIKTFAALACKAGVISHAEKALIADVKGYSHKEGKHIDQQRQAENIPTRLGHKKSEPVSIPADILPMLKNQPNTGQGRRDALLMCLLLDHGLRIGEIAALTRKDFNLKAGLLRFYRAKVDMTQTHELTADTRRAARAYLQHDAPASGMLWRTSHKGTGKLLDQMSEVSATRALTKRVELLGRKAGIEGLSAHDGRHAWATIAVKNKTSIDRLKDAGGWKSVAMPLRYIEAGKIANEGVNLGDDT
jgi:integrase